MSQIRPIRWHDLPWAYRLIGHGASFDSQFRVTVGEGGLRTSLLNIRSDIHAFVLRDRLFGLGILTFSAGALCAGLAYLAPSLDDHQNADLWLDMLDGLTASAGQHGIAAIRAEVDEHDFAAFEMLRQSDFAVYARQSLWEGRLVHTNRRARIALHRAEPLEIRTIADAWNARLPGLLRQTNLLPDPSNECYLLDERHTPCGIAAVYRGSQHTLVDVYLPLEASDRVEEVLGGLVDVLGKTSARVTIRLRHDMEWVGNYLADAGLECRGTQAVMLRHSLAHVRRYSFKAAPVKTGAIPTTGIMGYHSTPDPTCR